MTNQRGNQLQIFNIFNLMMDEESNSDMTIFLYAFNLQHVKCGRVNYKKNLTCYEEGCSKNGSVHFRVSNYDSINY